ncbi:hypothetical protein SAMN05880582_107189 [Rhizobium sp. RU20A]|uniref:hypothetical protein n=1 Tax=Rhizobium sp. RU20A TaxID=1907412 RepID=UPI000955424B|nr:hypothetical protein [Rhizobium sp. RU20A]SIR19214.1 hypothetical protein SAMN05880582_107189 [Rhizobium sp. RU20A]
MNPVDFEVMLAVDRALAAFDFSMVASDEGPTCPRVEITVPHVSLAARECEAFYLSLNPDTAADLKATAARIKAREATVRAGIIQTGLELIQIKDSLPGQFDRWLKLEFDMSKSTAWNYINVAEKFAAAPKVVEILPPATVYKLAAKATPDAVRTAVVDEINAGAVPTKKEVETRIRRARGGGSTGGVATEREADERTEAQEKLRTPVPSDHCGNSSSTVPSQTTPSKVTGDKTTAEPGGGAASREAGALSPTQAAVSAADFLRRQLGGEFTVLRSFIESADMDQFRLEMLKVEHSPG